jgi:hypothetical protein
MHGASARRRPQLPHLLFDTLSHGRHVSAMRALLLNSGFSGAAAASSSVLSRCTGGCARLEAACARTMCGALVCVYARTAAAAAAAALQFGDSSCLRGSSPLIWALLHACCMVAPLWQRPCMRRLSENWLLLMVPAQMCGI